MSDRDLRKLYESVRRGDEYVAPKRESDLYNNIYSENRKTPRSDTYDDFADEFARMYGEKVSYIEHCIKHGLDCGVFEESLISPGDGFKALFHPEFKTLFDWIVSNVPTKGNLLKIFFSDQGVGSSTLADMFISKMESSRTFNMFNLISEALETLGWRGVRFDSSMDVMNLRPQSDRNATRGAAGPGEALMAFMFSGRKPEVGDLAIEGSGGDLIVELKFKGGRIGKGINQKKMTEVLRLVSFDLLTNHNLHVYEWLII